MLEKVNLEKNDALDIAVIGMVGRFPGAGSVDEFWENIRDGVESLTFFTDEELLAAGVDPALLNNPKYVKAGRIIDGIDLFDAQFFGINPKEAEIMDPQQRIFLESAWEALENAGYDPKTYAGAISLHAGVSTNTYVWNVFANRDLYKSVGHYQTVIGNDKDFLTSRVAYKLDLKGPSVTVQSACSTSLVAVHLACQGLLNGDSDIALAGGVSVGSPQKTGYLYQEDWILSPDGHCRAFDARAQGTVGGMGIGIVVLKRLEDALTDGDSIHAVIKGSAINNDGSLKVGFTAPGVDGQARVIQEAQLAAGVDAETITYVETHGTGTILGDPIEIAGLTKAFGNSTTKKGFCAIGSVKTNVGHLDAAAGVTGLIRTVLALKHKQLPPSLNFTEPNPQIDFGNTPFYVNTTLSDWPRTNGPRRAGVSSFGIGGTNAHVIVEEAPDVVEAEPSPRPYQLLTVSARTESALAQAGANLSSHLRQHPELNLPDVAYTLQVGRRAFPRRRTVVCRDHDEAVTALAKFDITSNFNHAREAEAEAPAVVFMFPGQGTQYVGMGEELYRTEPVFRQTIDRCSEILQPALGLDLKDVLYPADVDTRAAVVDELKKTWLAQPALFAVEYALAQLWMSWGVQPRALIGHSLGEYVAACVSGVMELEDALRLVARRGLLMEEQEHGAMLAVACSEEKLDALPAAGVWLAAVNGPKTCVVSGPVEAIDTFARKLRTEGIASQSLQTSYAFHSALMEPMLDQFTEAVRKVNLRSPRIPYLSNVTGTWIKDEEATSPTYWTTHVRQTVRFADGLKELFQNSSILLEVGPGKTLTGLAKGQVDGPSAAPLMLASMRRANEKGSDEALLLTTLGRLWEAGVQVSWSGFHGGTKLRRVTLPTYPFERQRYWAEPQPRTGEGTRKSSLRKQELSQWFYAPSWKRTVVTSAIEHLDSSWLVFEDECGLGAGLVERLEARGHHIFSVKKGEGFAKVGERAFVVNPGKQSDYQALLDEICAASNAPPSKITHLWSVQADGQDRQAVDDFTGLLFLVKAITEQDASNSIQVEIILNNAQEVTGEEALSIENATIPGACRIIPQLYPNAGCRSIDVVLPPPESPQQERLIDQLRAEVLAAPTDINIADVNIAYRGKYRWAQTFAAVQLNEAGAVTSRLKDGGTYLITNGLDHLSISFAECIAQKVRANLVLISREVFPAREDWDEWLATHGEENETSERIGRIRALESLGAQVLLFNADVSEQMRIGEVISRTREQCGEIDGIIHSPEVTQETNPFSIDLCGIADLLKSEKPDWLVLSSPLSSMIGESDQAAAYTMNAYLNAFAQHESGETSSYIVSINWDTGISSVEGKEIFNRILLNCRLPQIIVSTTDLNERIERARSAVRLRTQVKTPLTQATHPRPALGDPYVAPANEIERLTARIWQELFGIEQVGTNDDFMELGGHSLLATQLMIRVREAFAVEIPIRTLFEAPTVAGLAAAIAQSREDNPVEELSKIIPVDRGNNEQILSSLDHLSDEEVDKLLGGLLAKQSPVVRT